MHKKIFPLALILIGFICCRAQQNNRMINFYSIDAKSSYYLCWDITTGKSMQYYWGGEKWDTMQINIPNPPIQAAVGHILFDVYYDSELMRTIYVVWDAKTGRSVQYYWNENKWDTMSVNLPTNPIAHPKGDILLSTYFHPDEKKAFYTFYDSQGGESAQYFWLNGAWSDMKYNLPSQPVR